MLRLTELKLPLDHPEADLRAEVVRRLGIGDDEIIGFTVHKRSYDARRRGAIMLIYTVDVELRGSLETGVVERRLAHVGSSPDMRYRFVAKAPDTLKSRPVEVLSCVRPSLP